MKIVLVKRTDARLSDEDRAIVQRFLFQAIDGVTERDQRAWRTFWRGVAKAPAGDYFSVTITRRRNTRFHKLVMKVLTEVFKAQEVFADFRIFKSFVKLGAGFVDFVPNPDGEIRAVPKSLSFEDCDEDQMQEFYLHAMQFLRSHRAQQVLWPALSPAVAEKGMERLLRQFDREQ